MTPSQANTAALNLGQNLGPPPFSHVGAAAHLVGPLHGDGEVVLSAGVPALADEHLVADAPRLPGLFGVEFSSNHLRADVPGFLRPGGEEDKSLEGKGGKRVCPGLRPPRSSLTV